MCGRDFFEGVGKMLNLNGEGGRNALREWEANAVEEVTAETVAEYFSPGDGAMERALMCVCVCARARAQALECASVRGRLCAARHSLDQRINTRLALPVNQCPQLSACFSAPAAGGSLKLPEVKR